MTSMMLFRDKFRKSAKADYGKEISISHCHEQAQREKYHFWIKHFSILQ